MSCKRINFQSVIISGKIYVIGGHNGTSFLNSVEVYDPATNTWTTKAPMSNPREQFKTEIVNGKVYAIGGQNAASSFLNSVELYDPTTNTWTTKAPMSNQRYNFQSVVINNKIYAIGGLNSNSSLDLVEEYDPTTDKWAIKSSMSSPRYSLQTEVINEKIYAIGGANNISLNSVEEYTQTAVTIPAPTNLTAATGSTGINLSWTTVSGASSYNVKRSTTSGGPYTTVASNITNTSYTDTTASGGITYYYVVTAVTPNGESGNSNEASASVTPTSSNCAILEITLTNGEVNEYDMTAPELNDFLTWYDGRAEGNGKAYFTINKKYNIKPFLSRKEYLPFDKILDFEVKEYGNN